METTEEWGDKPWLETPDEALASRMDAILPALGQLEAAPGASTLHTIRPDATPSPGTPRQSGVAVTDEVLGRGGMSVVLLGHQRSLGRSVAIKTIGEPEEGAPENHHVSDVLLREAQITGRLEHPNVLPLYDLCVDAVGRPQLILKRIEGRPWTDFIREPELVNEQPGSADAQQWHLQVFLQVCNAIRFAHARGVIHRDLKPDNVMIGSFGEVYVLDWGIAVRRDEESSATLAGTPAYMAPEMAAGEDLDERTDVYLLGAVLFELFEERPPHGGKNFAMVMWSALTSRPVLSEKTPPGFADVIRCAMQRDRAERYGSVEALQDAIAGAIERRDVSALCLEATKRLEELEAMLAEAHATEVSAAEVHELYGQVRFGLKGVLSRYDDWADALTGLRRLHIAMTTYALNLGETATAEGYLARVDPPEPSLAAAIEERRSKDAMVTDRLKALEAFRSDLDENQSRKRRFKLAVFLGIVWTTQALYLQFSGSLEGLTHRTGMLSPLINSAVLLALLKLRKGWNRYDRRLLALSSLGFFAEFGLDVSLYFAGSSPTQALVHDLVVRAFTVGVLAIYVERALVLPAIMLGVGAIASSIYPDHLLWWVAATDAVVLGVLAYRWRPGAEPDADLLRGASTGTLDDGDDP